MYTCKNVIRNHKEKSLSNSFTSKGNRLKDHEDSGEDLNEENSVLSSSGGTVPQK